MRAGATVGPYRLETPIGAGGTGVVYAATPTSSGPRVAVKMLYRENLVDERAMRRFRSESIAGRIVRHANVMRVLGRGETDDGLPYLVLEHVAGERVAEIVDREGSLALPRALAIVHQVLAGLRAIHGAGIVHGDIKADNVLVDEDDTAKLIDFGLARVSFAVGDDVDRELEVVSGTPDYMAPELIVGEVPNALSDLYAVGCLLFELLTGAPPFAGGSTDDVVQRQLESEVIPPSLRRAGYCPAILDRIVLRALEKDPAKRFPDAAAFERAVLVALRSLADDASTPSPSGTQQLGRIQVRARGSYL